MDPRRLARARVEARSEAPLRLVLARRRTAGQRTLLRRGRLGSSAAACRSAWKTCAQGVHFCGRLCCSALPTES